MKTLLYITRWVIKRGIIVLEGVERIDAMSQGFRNTYYLVDMPHGLHRRDYMLALGRDCFLTLEDAQADAQRRFEAHLAKSKAEAKWAQKAIKKLEQGKLQAHEEVANVKDIHAFD